MDVICTLIHKECFIGSWQQFHFQVYCIIGLLQKDGLQLMKRKHNVFCCLKYGIVLILLVHVCSFLIGFEGNALFIIW